MNYTVIFMLYYIYISKQYNFIVAIHVTVNATVVKTKFWTYELTIC